MEINQARPGAPNSRCLSLVGAGSPHLFTSSSRKVWGAGQLAEGEPLISVPKEGGCLQQTRSCPLLPPAPLCGFRGLFKWLTAVVLLLTFTKMACCHLAFCRGSPSKATSSSGTVPQPYGMWTGNPEALVAIIDLGGPLQNAQKTRGQGERLPLLQMGKSGFVNANTLPELCI